MVQPLIFAFLAIVTLGGAAGVVTARSVFASALFLVLALFGVAGMYVLLQASFLAAVQLLIYVGAISVLIIFAVMLTPQVMEDSHLANSQWPLAGVVAVAMFGSLAALAYRADWPLASDAALPPNGAVVVTEQGAEGGLTMAAARQLPGAIVEKDTAGNEIVRLPGTVERLGRAFVTDYLLAFEVISVILLVALIGAVAIARE
ncbi:MAG: NADH-quinone oxidoreductase subunit J [Anaerolineae bacterium]